MSELRIAFPQANLAHQHSGTGTANIDPDRLHQLIGNLVANSVAYGDVLKPITATSVIEESHATLTVHNEGPAIPDSLLAVLFEPMTRGASVTTMYEASDLVYSSSVRSPRRMGHRSSDLIGGEGHDIQRQVSIDELRAL